MFRLPQWIAGLAEEISDLLFPPRCAGCGRPGVVWRSTCAADTRPLTPSICSLCGIPWVTGERCPRCQKDPLQLEGVRSCFVHHGPIRRALHRMKFHGRYRIAQALASQMAEGWARFGVEADLLIPVPTSKARQQQRGYNQAAMLAHALAERLAIPFHAYALRRARATRSQEGLARSARRENVRGAFLGDPAGYQGKRVVAVDDVCTSIVPLEACATALYQAGAASGWGFTLARAIMSKAPHE